MGLQHGLINSDPHARLDKEYRQFLDDIIPRR